MSCRISVYIDDVALVGDVIVTLSLAPIQEEAEAGIVRPVCVCPARMLCFFPWQRWRTKLALTEGQDPVLLFWCAFCRKGLDIGELSLSTGRASDGNRIWNLSPMATGVWYPRTNLQSDLLSKSKEEVQYSRYGYWDISGLLWPLTVSDESNFLNHTHISCNFPSQIKHKLSST